MAISESHCVLVNNVWNNAAAGRGFEQEVFLEDLNGTSQPGWRWRSPWQIVPTVVSQPQLICGDKPWDEPRHLIPEFPFRVASKRLTADFDLRMNATGTYNTALTLWAVSSLPAARNVISHEIMIWIAKAGQSPAGYRRGSIQVKDTTYDLYVEQEHRDASGVNRNTWTYVAFVARVAVLHGTLDITEFTKYLVEQKLLSTDAYLTSLELGNEVCAGTGIVEVKVFSLQIL